MSSSVHAPGKPEQGRGPGVDIALGRKPKEEAPVVVASSSEPTDIETDGIEVPIDDRTSVYAPPQPPTDPFAPRPRRKR